MQKVIEIERGAVYADGSALRTFYTDDLSQVTINDIAKAVPNGIDGISKGSRIFDSNLDLAFVLEDKTLKEVQ